MDKERVQVLVSSCYDPGHDEEEEEDEKDDDVYGFDYPHLYHVCTDDDPAVRVNIVDMLKELEARHLPIEAATLGEKFRLILGCNAGGDYWWNISITVQHLRTAALDIANSSSYSSYILATLLHAKFQQHQWNDDEITASEHAELVTLVSELYAKYRGVTGINYLTPLFHLATLKYMPQLEQTVVDWHCEFQALCMSPKDKNLRGMKALNVKFHEYIRQLEWYHHYYEDQYEVLLLTVGSCILSYLLDERITDFLLEPSRLTRLFSLIASMKTDLSERITTITRLLLAGQKMNLNPELLKSTAARLALVALADERQAAQTILILAQADLIDIRNDPIIAKMTYDHCSVIIANQFATVWLKHRAPLRLLTDNIIERILASKAVLQLPYVWIKELIETDHLQLLASRLSNIGIAGLQLMLLHPVIQQNAVWKLAVTLALFFQYTDNMILDSRLCITIIDTVFAELAPTFLEHYNPDDSEHTKRVPNYLPYLVPCFPWSAVSALASRHQWTPEQVHKMLDFRIMMHNEKLWTVDKEFNFWFAINQLLSQGTSKLVTNFLQILRYIFRIQHDIPEIEDEVRYFCPLQFSNIERLLKTSVHELKFTTCPWANIYYHCLLNKLPQWNFREVKLDWDGLEDPYKLISRENPDLTSRWHIVNGEGYDAGGPSREFFQRLGKSLARFFVVDASGYLLPSIDISYEDLELVAKILAKCVAVDRISLGLELHPLLLVHLAWSWLLEKPAVPTSLPALMFDGELTEYVQYQLLDSRDDILDAIPGQMIANLLGKERGIMLAPQWWYQQKDDFGLDAKIFQHELQLKWESHIHVIRRLATKYHECTGPEWDTVNLDLLDAAFAGQKESRDQVIGLVQCNYLYHPVEEADEKTLEMLNLFRDAFVAVITDMTPIEFDRLQTFWFGTTHPKFSANEIPSIVLRASSEGWVIARTCSLVLEFPQVKVEDIGRLLQESLHNQQLAEESGYLYQFA